MIASIIPVITGLISTVIDKTIADKTLAENLKSEITLEILNHKGKELEAAASIILAEAKGESWLQRNWRPLLMMNFAILITAHWLGFTGENLSQDTINQLLDIVKIGIGGYVLSRGGEKMMKIYKEK